MHDHPVLKLIGIIVTIVTVMSAGVGVWFYLEDLRNENSTWYEDDKSWNDTIISQQRQILDGQAEMRKELATQSLLIVELEARVEDLEAGQRLLQAAISNVRANVAFELGRHEGMHHSDGSFEVDGICESC